MEEQSVLLEVKKVRSVIIIRIWVGRYEGETKGSISRVWKYDWLKCNMSYQWRIVWPNLPEGTTGGSFHNFLLDKRWYIFPEVFSDFAQGELDRRDGGASRCSGKRKFSDILKVCRLFLHEPVVLEVVLHSVRPVLWSYLYYFIAMMQSVENS